MRHDITLDSCQMGWKKKLYFYLSLQCAPYTTTPWHCWQPILGFYFRVQEMCWKFRDTNTTLVEWNLASVVTYLLWLNHQCRGWSPKYVSLIKKGQNLGAGMKQTDNRGLKIGLGNFNSFAYYWFCRPWNKSIKRLKPLIKKKKKKSSHLLGNL